MQGLLGRKLGMTRVFDDAGRQVPVTAIEIGPCVVLQRKTKASDGYDAVQVGFGEQKEQRLGKPLQGLFKKAGVTPKRHLQEFPVEAGEDPKVGEIVTASIFEKTTFVDVRGLTKGRGFQGVVKRYRMSGGPMTHGGHSKRRPGSIGNRTTPARVHKGKRMPGRMGGVTITQRNLKIVALRKDENVLLVEGAVPGANGGILVVRRALKEASKA